ncbi:MAG: phospholipase D-like domain-containing protein [Planctomycetota bacterium]
MNRTGKAVIAIVLAAGVAALAAGAAKRHDAPPPEFDANVTPLVDGDYLPAVRELLRGAKSSILCVMFLAQPDDRHPDGPESALLDDLIGAGKRGVAVTVILDRTPERGESEDGKNRSAHDRLRAAGVPVFYDSPDRTTHSKVIVVDEEAVVIGSANWTYSALKRNHEASVLIRSRDLAVHLKKRLLPIRSEAAEDDRK